MDTLVAGYREQKIGPVSEALIVAEDATTGRVEIELGTFDENYKPDLGGTSTQEGLIARSSITIPAGLMDKVVRQWMESHPNGVEEEHYDEFQAADASTESSLPAAKFVGGRLESLSR